MPVIKQRNKSIGKADIWEDAAVNVRSLTVCKLRGTNLLFGDWRSISCQSCIEPFVRMILRTGKYVFGSSLINHHRRARPSHDLSEVSANETSG